MTIEGKYIYNDTRVRLFDAMRNKICSWRGYNLPCWLASHINEIANMNSTMSFRLEWDADDGPQSIPLHSGPLAIMVLEVLDDYRVIY